MAEVEGRTRWAKWRAAEGLIESKGIDAAAQTLSPRLALLLRAIDAARIGDRETYKQLAEDPAADLAFLTVIDITAERPGTFDPTRVRATVKRAGLTNDPYPFLDLLRLMVVSVNGGTTDAKRTLKYRREELPLMTIATAALHDSYVAYEFDAEIAERSPALDPFYYAALLRRRQFLDVQDLMRLVKRRSNRFSDEHWPDLNICYEDGEPITRHSSSNATGVDDFAKAPLEEVWSLECDAEVEKARNDSARGPKVLGELLRALDALVRAGRLGVARPVLGACRSLAPHHAPEETREMLVGQLEALHMRVGLLVESADERVLSAAWRASGSLPRTDRAVVARRLIDRTRSHWPGEMEAFAAALGAGHMADESPRLVAQQIAGMPVHLQRDVLGQLSVGRRELVEGWCQWDRKNPFAALQLADKALVHRSHAPDAVKLVLLAVVEWSMEGRPRSEEFLGAICGFLRRLAKLGVRLKPLQFGMLHAVGIGRGHERSDELLSVLGLHLSSAASNRLSEDEWDHVTSYLEVSVLTEGFDSARERFRMIGRGLRESSEEDRLSVALIIGRNLVVRRDEGVSVEMDELFGRWEKAMAALLQSSGDPRVAEVATRLVEEGHAETVDLEKFIRRHPPLGHAANWRHVRARSRQPFDPPANIPLPLR